MIAGQSITYQARRLPDPKAILAGHAFGEYVPADSISTQTALHTRFPEDFNFEADCKILDFHLTRLRPREDPEDADNTGSDFNPKTSRILEATQSGDRLLFYDIRVQCPGDKAPRMIDALSLRVR